MRDPKPPTSRALLDRIAEILDVSPAAFLDPGRRGRSVAGPTPAECDEVVMLYRRIADPLRRAALVKLMREMATTD